MPNWIEGTLKLRGKTADIIRFLDNGLDCTYEKPRLMCKQEMYDDRDSMKICGVYYRFQDPPYIKGSKRAYIDSPSCSIDWSDEKDSIICLDIHKAWGFICDAEDKKLWDDISENYHLDLKLFGIECGQCFCEKYEKLRGVDGDYESWTYDDWMWECPFPYMGG